MTSQDNDPAEPGVVVAEAQPRPQGKQKRSVPLWLESIVLFALAMAVALLLKTFFLQAFFIPSASMEPGLREGDRILVQKVSYWGKDTPERGDVVVFKDPGNWLPTDDAPTNVVGKALVKVGLQPSGGHLVKRVIGVAGDTIVCCDDEGRITVNGRPLDESAYVKDDDLSPCNGPMGPGDCDWQVGPIPEGHVFVMGDNRNDSADSSAHMCAPEDTTCVPGDEFVDTDLVVGKVFSLVWPAKRFEWVGRPEEFAKVPDPS